MFKNPSFIFDILCTVVWLVLAIRYARKGFLAGAFVFSVPSAWQTHSG